MKILLLILCWSTSIALIPPDNENVTIVSWNIRDFGKTKSDVEIQFIANTVKPYDIVMIQEVVAGPGGAQAVAKLNDELNRLGDQWAYTVSDPTFGDSYKTERYAFLWKPSKVKKIGDAWLEQQYKTEIDREPYYATFSKNDKTFTLANFHAITKSKQPETEIKYFKFLPAQYPALNLLFCGDFNLPQSHTVFFPLRKMGYTSALVDQKTSLRQQCINDDCLASEFDNIYYNDSLIAAIDKGIIPFYRSFPGMEAARTVSDHVPVYFEFRVK